MDEIIGATYKIVYNPPGKDFILEMRSWGRPGINYRFKLNKPSIENMHRALGEVLNALNTLEKFGFGVDLGDDDDNE